MKNRAVRQSTITVTSLVAASVLIALLWGGIFFTNRAYGQLESAQERERQLIELGQQVAVTSELLTRTVRSFVMTGDRSYLDEYWNEIEVTESQNVALEGLQELGVADEHFALIDEANANSMALVETETRAMRLALEVAGVPEAQMPGPVAEYTLSDEDAALDDEARLQTAQRILFDDAYEHEVSRIMGPIDEFTATLEAEAAEETAQAASGNDRAQRILIGVGLIIPFVLGGLLWVVHSLMGRPVTRYTRALAQRSSDDRDFRLSPEGTAELRTLAGELNDQLQESAELVEAIGSSIASSAEKSAGQASVVSAASEQVSQNVNTVATAIEELNASVSEIAQSANEASTVAGEAVQRATDTNTTVAKLGTSSTEIGAVVQTITAIAEQTNLLALNATIEAARAGEAGKGFAVVAGEVKDLAQQTARATEDISAKVSAIQGDTESAVEEIGGIADIIDRISAHQQSISSAVEEQTATTGEIARNIAEAAKGVTEVSEGIAAVAAIAQSAGATDEAADASTGGLEAGQTPQGRQQASAAPARENQRVSAGV